MTTPSERSRALRWGWEFLNELLSSNAVTHEVNQTIDRLLVHYPTPDEIAQWAALPQKGPFANVLGVEEGYTDTATTPGIHRPAPSAEQHVHAILDARSFFQSLRGSDLPQELARQIPYVLRHYPDKSMEGVLRRHIQRAQRVILFLDFDGVLHPQSPSHENEDFFCRGPLLDEALRNHHESVEIVISSSWAERFSLQDIREFLPGVADMVVDVTERVPPGSVSNYSRQAECEQWLRKHCSQQKWVAIDDCALLFEPNCPNLVLTQGSVGLNELAVMAIEGKILERLKTSHV